MQTKTLFYITASFALLLSIVFARQPVLPPPASELVGLWVGYENGYPYFYRLNLKTNNTGRLIIMFPEAEPDVYDLHWRLNERKLILDALPLTKNSEVINCAVSNLTHRRMDIIISGGSNEWHRTARLLNERLLSARIVESGEYEAKPALK